MTRIGQGSAHYLTPSWSGDARPLAPQQRAPAQEGRYQNSFSPGGQRVGAWSGGVGNDTSGLRTASQGKMGFLAGLLSKLPDWEKSGQFKVGTAGYVAQGSFEGLGGLASGSGRASFLEASLSGDGSVSFKDGALKAQGNLHAQATLVDAEGKIHLGSGDYSLDATGSAFVGAKADAHGELTIDPKNGVYAAKVGGEAFVGARAGVEGNVNLGTFGGVGGSAEAWAGVGAAFHAEARFKDGRFKARVDVGAALGIGFKLGFNVDINVKGIVDAVKEPFKAIGSAVSGAVSEVKDVASKAVDGAKNAVKSVGHFLSSIF